MRKNQWFKWFIIEIDKTIQQAADGRVCLRKKLTKNGLLLLDKTRFPFQIALDQGIPTSSDSSDSGAVKQHWQTSLKSIMGTDCKLELTSIQNICRNLAKFFVWVYQDCRGSGANRIKQLGRKCGKIKQIQHKIATFKRTRIF